MKEIIFTKIYHGGILSEISVPTYVGNCVPALRYIIKDHFSILELLYYTKKLGYETVRGFYVKDLLNKKWILITTDQHLLHQIKDLKHEDTFEVFVWHVLDEPLLDTEGPRGYLTNVGGKGVDVDLGEEAEVVNLGGEDEDVKLGGEGEVVDLSGEGEAVNLGGEGVDVNIGEEGEDVNLGGEVVDDNLGGEGVDDNLGREGESDFLSSDSNLDIPSEDGSDIDEEGVDIPARRRSKKVRYDENCEVSIFELGMVFEDVNQFRKAVTDYAIEYMRQIKLRPNEKYRFWKCSKASFEVKFREKVHAMSQLGKKEIIEDLLHYDPKNWSRAFFQTHSKCDVVENNLCETFNSWILAARHKSIITMLEVIRHKMMNRHIDMIKFVEIRHCTYGKDNTRKKQGISEGEYSFVVDLEKKHCDCRLWMLREHWYKKETFLKAYNHFIQPIFNMRMCPETTNPSIELPKPREIPGRPGKKRRKSKDGPKKWGKLSRKEVKMTCSICKKTGHNKILCARYGRGSTSKPTSQGNSIQQSYSQTGVRTQLSQQSVVCADTTVVPRITQTTSTMGGPSYSNFRTTYAPTQSSQPSSICADTTFVPRPPQNRVQVGTGRRLGRKKANARGTPFVTERDSSSSLLPPLSGHKRPYSSASFPAATGGNRRHATGFGPSTSSEKILHGPTKLKNASPTNIDIGFKPRGLKWKGKDAIGTSQLQQMKANRKKWK
ncbi:hypothetical protein H5410_061997 [Solanum commersonii]|uniref:Transposase MuDR plant domain-containing protein n=1 Tax=Solanum commersonii TaxID=4109 RepID=A0A9J5WA77_SOLCO|nr:hypothetical protein H5410_061997 [Solanum commersonii]